MAEILNLQDKPDPFEEEDGTSGKSANDMQSQETATENNSGESKRPREPEILFKKIFFLCGLRKLYRQPERNKMRPYTTYKDPRAEATPPEPKEKASFNDPNTLFERFLDSLAQVCCFDDKSHMVTAALVEQTDAGPVFHVTRNGTESDGTERNGDYLKIYLVGVLKRIRSIRENTEEEFLEGRCKAFKSLLMYVVKSTTGKLKHYANRLQNHASSCLRDLRKKGKQTEVGGTVERLKEAAKKDDLVDLILRAETEYPYVKHYIGGMVIDTAEGSWKKLCHVVGRLRSYHTCMKYFYHASRQFPELFTGCKVHFLRPKPATTLYHCWDDDSVKAFFENIKEFLDDRWKDDKINSLYGKIKEVVAANRKGMPATRRGINCAAHAEVALAHWFWKERTIRDETGGSSDKSDSATWGTREHARIFFRGWAYVGTSKPCCPLCVEFFRVHKSGIRGRAPHSNLYPKWMVPGDGIGAGEVKGFDQKWMVPGNGTESDQKEVDSLNLAIQEYCHEMVLRYLLPGGKYDDSIHEYDSADEDSDCETDLGAGDSEHGSK